MREQGNHMLQWVPVPVSYSSMLVTICPTVSHYSIITGQKFFKRSQELVLIGSFFTRVISKHCGKTSLVTIQRSVFASASGADAKTGKP